MPTRGEWVEMLSALMPAWRAAALRRRARVLADMSNTSASGSAFGGLICWSAWEAGGETETYAPLAVWSVFERRM